MAIDWNGLTLPDKNIYHVEDDVIIYCGDCREILPELPKVDLVLTDPPYGIDVIGGSKSFGSIGGSKSFGSIGGSKSFGSIGGSNIVNVNKYISIEGDNEPFNPTFLLGYGKNQIIWGANYFADKLPNSKGWIVWDKKLKNNWDDNFSDVELAWSSFNKPTRCFRHLYMGLLQEGDRETRVHPTQKPIPLFSWVISKYSEVNDLILDPFLGSGTTAVCAKKLGRKCIGVEISENYCRIAVERLRQQVLPLEIEQVQQGHSTSQSSMLFGMAPYR
jgi:DNA modification methylase